MTKFLLTALASCVVLAGCGVNQPAPAVKYHLLDHNNSTLSQRLPSPVIAVNEIVLADYLQQPNLVMRVADNQLRIANYHSWAEPLGKAIQRIVLSDLNRQNTDFGFVERCQQCTQIEITVEHFYPDQAGKVTLSGYFSIEKAEQPQVVEYFSLTQEQDGAGYAESVKTMNQLVTKLAGILQQTLSE